jgi:hypothetical protein
MSTTARYHNTADRRPNARGSPTRLHRTLPSIRAKHSSGLTASVRLLTIGYPKGPSIGGRIVRLQPLHKVVGKGFEHITGIGLPFSGAGLGVTCRGITEPSGPSTPPPTSPFALGRAAYRFRTLYKGKDPFSSVWNPDFALSPTHAFLHPPQDAPEPVKMTERRERKEREPLTPLEVHANP